MRIALDVSAAVSNNAGSGNYVAHLECALREQPDLEVVSLSSVQGRALGERRSVRTRLATLRHDLLWTQLVFPAQARKANAELLHSPTGIAPLHPGLPSVVTILDASPLRYPQYFRPWQRWHAGRVLPRAARAARRVLVISEFVKREVVELFGVPGDRVQVTYPGVDSIFRRLDDETVRRTRERYGPFILAVCTLEPRKNMVRLIEAFSLLNKRGFPQRLIHVGSRGWLDSSIFETVERLGLASEVQFLGRQSTETLLELYNAADLLAYPSLYEGFGLPLVEAMCCGCPVVCARGSSLTEVAAGACKLVEPLEVESIFEGIAEVLEKPALGAELRSRGYERCAMFTWEVCARKTSALYRDVVESR